MNLHPEWQSTGDFYAALRLGLQRLCRPLVSDLQKRTTCPGRELCAARPQPYASWHRNRRTKICRRYTELADEQEQRARPTRVVIVTKSVQ